MIEIIMIIIKKTQKWESKGSPGIEKFLLTSLVSMFLRVSKWPWAVIFYKNRFQSLKIWKNIKNIKYLSRSKPLINFVCKIWAKSMGLSVRSFSDKIRSNQHLNKEIWSNRSVQEKSFAIYITENLWLKFSNSITKRAKLRKFDPHFIMVMKNPFKKLEYYAVSHADIEIFSVENDRLTNVLLIDGCLGRHSRLINETK